MKKIIFISFLVANFGCRTIDVKKASNGFEGVFYKLPATQLQIEVEIKTTTYTKSGCFGANKGKLEGKVSKSLLDALDKMSPGESLINRKISSFTISPRSVEDQSKFYSISTSRKLLQNRTFGFNFNERGFLEKADFTAEDQAIPILTQVVSSTASVVGSVVGVRAGAAPAKNPCDNFLELADLISAKRLEFVTFEKISAPGGNEMPGKETYERVLLELDKMDLNIFGQLFFTTDIKTEKIILRYLPAKSADHLFEKPILAFDAGSGNVHVNKDVIAPRYTLSGGGSKILFESETDLPKQKSISIYSLKIDGDGIDKADIDSLPGNSSTSAGGFFYNIPIRCQVYITNSAGKIYQTEIDLPQWGRVGRLSKNLSKLNVVLNPLTGALVNVSGESKGLSAEQLKALGESLEKARDVFIIDDLAKMDKQIQLLEKKAKLNSFEDTELKQLVAAKELLKEKKEIAELKKAIAKMEE